jgi:transposase
MREKRSRRRYDAEFKREAIRLVVEGGRTAAEVARSLGIEPKVLQRWKRESEAFPGPGRPKPSEEELWRLRRELAEVTEERDILKKALAIFSKRPR